MATEAKGTLLGSSDSFVIAESMSGDVGSQFSTGAEKPGKPKKDNILNMFQTCARGLLVLWQAALAADLIMSLQPTYSRMLGFCIILEHALKEPEKIRETVLSVPDVSDSTLIWNSMHR